MGKKVDIGRRKNDTGNENRKTIDISQRSYLPGVLIEATGKQMGWAFIYLHSQPIRTYRD